MEYVQDGPRNLPLKFGQNRVSNSWDIADIEFLWGGVVVWFAQSFSCPTFNYIEVTLLLSWGCDNTNESPIQHPCKNQVTSLLHP